MKKLSEGQKMFVSVMVVFAVYALIFILFEDYDRKFLQPFDEVSDWHLLLFSLVVMTGLAYLLHRYARRMDERISREQAAKENQMRRELTQNIAHELKTPVASILGYTDTILDDPQMPPETQRQFIERTNAQAQRLTSLLQDISTLNRMDYAAHQLTMERTDVSAIVSDDISAEQTDDNWMFRFSDNGVGITPEHLPRIFERFYRIDKSRSRSIGGTGLGLAIVKNAVLLHGGQISAKNAVGSGLQFDFILKK
jgi:two-component system OmpR family sensor kinase/two-component system phosphate regulon sensor histidine kinase PhoR